MMRSIIMKIVKIFKENIWLSVTVVLILLIVGATGWNWSLNVAGNYRLQDSVHALHKVDTQKEETMSESSVKNSNKAYDGLHVVMHDGHGFSESEKLGTGDDIALM